MTGWIRMSRSGWWARSDECEQLSGGGVGVVSNGRQVPGGEWRVHQVEG